VRRVEIISEFTVCLPRREQANQLNQKRRGFRADKLISSALVCEVCVPPLGLEPNRPIPRDYTHSHIESCLQYTPKQSRDLPDRTIS